MDEMEVRRLASKWFESARAWKQTVRHYEKMQAEKNFSLLDEKLLKQVIRNSKLNCKNAVKKLTDLVST